MDFNSVASSRPPFIHGQVYSRFFTRPPFTHGQIYSRSRFTHGLLTFHLFRFLVGMSTFIFVVNHRQIVRKEEKIRNMARLV